MLKKNGFLPTVLLKPLHSKVEKLLRLAEKKRGNEIMAEEEDALKNLLFGKTWEFQWLKWNDCIDGKGKTKNQ